MSDDATSRRSDGDALRAAEALKAELEADAGSRELVPLHPSSTEVARLDEGAGAAPVAAAQLQPVLEAAAGGAPVRIATLSETRTTLRLTVSFWARPEIVVERRTGSNPIGPVVDAPGAAVAALTPLAEGELARGRGLQALRARVDADPWAALKGLQGDDAGPMLTERRSVVKQCDECAGAGGFACVDCSGVGRRVCAVCSGAGRVDQECPSCRGALKPAQNAPLALEPRRILRLILGQASAGGGAPEELRRAAGANDADAQRGGCAECRGVGAVRADCANCAGAGERLCGSCSGSGRVKCSACAGAGFLTDVFAGRLRFERSVHVALSTGVADQEPSAEAVAAIRASWSALAEAKAFTPKLVGFQSSGFAAQAIFEGEISITQLRAYVGARAPRTALDFWAAGKPAMLLDPPKALDMLHRRAVDRARVSTREGRRQVADALSGIAAGRAALRAAARRERNLPPGAFGPLASDAENARLLDLARDAHAAVGWRDERRVWTAAALMAAPIGALAAWTVAPSDRAQSVASAAPPDDPLLRLIADGWGAVTYGAQAFWAGFAPIAPFLALWMLTGLAAAWAYRRATRRTLGFSRARSAWRFYFGGAAPLSGLAAGLLLYTGGFLGAAQTTPWSAPPPQAIQATAVAVETPEPGPAPKAAPKEKRQAETLGKWRAMAGKASSKARDGSAAIRARCERGRMFFELSGSAVEAASGRLRVRWLTERTGLAARDLRRRTVNGRSRPVWRASAAAVRALGRDRRLSVIWWAGGRSGRHVFDLSGARRALQVARVGC